jgi:hypothetical protein
MVQLAQQLSERDGDHELDGPGDLDHGLGAAPAASPAAAWRAVADVAHTWTGRQDARVRADVWIGDLDRGRHGDRSAEGELLRRHRPGHRHEHLDDVLDGIDHRRSEA